MSVLPTVVPLNINVNSFKFLSLNTNHDKNSEGSSSDAAVPSVRTQQFVVLSLRYHALYNNKVVKPHEVFWCSVFVVTQLTLQTMLASAALNTFCTIANKKLFWYEFTILYCIIYD